MKQAWWMLLLLCPLAHGLSCPTQAKDEDALIRAEQTWARALEEQDVPALGCILADEFEDANATGALSDRATTLRRAEKSASSHHKLSDMHAHVYGDAGYIRGVATALATDGRPKAIVRFTDVYVYRDGRWQCVAGHESELPIERP